MLTFCRLSSAKHARRAAQPRARLRSRCAAVAPASRTLDALLFDCDGVLCDTERDGHRVTFNAAFAEKGLSCVWSEEEYGELLKTGGGKERMTLYFGRRADEEPFASRGEAERAAFVAELHALKTRLFVELVERGELRLRPGVARLVNEAMQAGVKLGVCSTSNEAAVSGIVRLLGPAAAAAMRVFAGDVVAKKKPDPSIYLLAAKELDVTPTRCVVIEDSAIGLRAAKAAGMRCIITKNKYTEEEDFGAADAIFDCIGEAGEPRFGLSEVICIAGK